MSRASRTGRALKPQTDRTRPLRILSEAVLAIVAIGAVTLVVAAVGLALLASVLLAARTMSQPSCDVQAQTVPAPSAVAARAGRQAPRWSVAFPAASSRWPIS